MYMEQTNIDAALAALNELPAAALDLLAPIGDKIHYERALAAEESLGKRIAGDPHHALGGLYSSLIANIARYEDKAFPTEPAPPHQILEFLMEQQGIRQSDLAEKLGVNQSNVSRLVRGQTAFTTDLIKELSAIFNVPPTVFVG